ncbi:MAG TPA: ATP-binding cassette domain-containing protein, partial [Myxococcota bacterium]|nr:ATP-binding cassette domain-containing protein [Myxococcota bacterium]
SEEPASAGHDGLDRLDLRSRAGARPRELSGGERRRVTLGQVWLADPTLLLADEPTAGLDASRKGEIIDLLLSRHSPERCFLLISHDLPLVLYACRRLLVMQAGRIIDDFPTTELFSPQRHPWTQKLCINAGLEPPCS